MDPPELWERVLLLRRWDDLMAEARGGAMIGDLEEGLVFAFGTGVLVWVGLFVLRMNAVMTFLLAVVGGYVFFRWTIWRLNRIRQRSPGFLSRGSEGVPGSRVRLSISVFILVMSGLFAFGMLIGMTVFVLAVPPFIVWSLTGLRWATLYVGLPLSLLALRGCLRLMAAAGSHLTRPHRPSKPSDRGCGDMREYEVRFGWHRPLRGFLAVGLSFVAVGCIAWSDAPVITVLSFGFFGSIVVYLVMGALMRNVAIRVGAAGVVLNESLMGDPAYFVPWSEIEAVEVSDSVDESGRIETIRVLRRIEGPPVVTCSVEAGSSADDTRARDTTWASSASAEAKFWRLDMVRLARAIEFHAPHVPLLDLRG